MSFISRHLGRDSCQAFLPGTLRVNANLFQTDLCRDPGYREVLAFAIPGAWIRQPLPALPYLLHGPGQSLDRFPVSPSPCSRSYTFNPVECVRRLPYLRPGWGRSVNNEERGAGGCRRTVRFRVVRHLVTHPGPQYEAPAIGELGVQLSVEAQQDVSLAAPVVRKVPRRIFHHSDT